MSLSELAEKSIGIGSITWGKLFSAVLTLLICLIIVRVLLRLLRRSLGRSKLDDRVQKYILGGVRLLAYIITALIVVDSLDVPTSSLVALLSVGSLGLTLAAEDILGNMAGGLVILSSRPFSIGDFIESSGTSGTVEEITLNHTKLLTPEGTVVMIPNKTLSDSLMTNYTAMGRRRICRKVTAAYGAPTETVKAACRKAVDGTPGVLSDPAPAVYLSSYGDSSIEYSVYCWAAPDDYWDVYFGVGERLRDTFADAGVEMTYNHLNVHVVEEQTGA